MTITIDQLNDWLDALRSGQYPQGRGQLKAPNGFCCLGVLADRLDPNGWTTPDTSDPSHTLSNPHGQYQKSQWLDDTLVPRHLQRKFAGANDTNTNTFHDIANLIEKHAEELTTNDPD